MKGITEDFIVDASNASPDQIKEALALLAKKKEREAKIKAGILKGDKKWSEMTEEEKEKARKYSRRREAERAILIEKAKAAGITVTDEEVELRLMEKGK